MTSYNNFIKNLQKYVIYCWACRFASGSMHCE